MMISIMISPKYFSLGILVLLYTSAISMMINLKNY